MAAFTAGNIVVYRVGDGTAALTSAATAVFLDEYTPTGTLVQSIAMPTADSGANQTLTAAGSSTSEGMLTLSTDGRYLLLAGYDAAPGTASVAAFPAAVVNRVVARVAADGTVDTTTALTDAASNSNIRGVASTDGSSFYVTGGGGGVRVTTLGATTSTQLSTSPTNLRGVNIFGGQLYVSAASGATRVATVGTGVPTTSGQVINNLTNFPITGSPYQFVFADLDAGVAGVDTLYVSDDSGGRGIEKYSLVSGSWVLNGVLQLAGARGLTASVTGTSVRLFATTGTALATFNDTSGYNGTLAGLVTNLTSAATNTAFRGVAFVPQAAPAVANNDAASTAENATSAISVLGNDTGGPPVNVTSINGTAATVGAAITLASGATATLNADGTISYNPNGQFNTLVDAATAAATGATNSSATDSFTYAVTGGSTATVTVTINGVASAGDQLGGSAGNNTVTGTAAADTFNMSAGGDDTVSGGDSNDAFIFGVALTGADSIDGGAGTNDQVAISGNYGGGNALTLGAGTLTNVEVLALLPGAGNGYSVTTNDANVAAGERFTVFAGNLAAGQNVTFNGSAETDGSFLVYGGLGTDTIAGGAQNDGFYFGPGRWQAGDIVLGGGGTNDQLALDGDYTVTIGAEADVETLALLAGPSGTPNSFAITLADGWVGAGQSRTVWGGQVSTTMTINGASETNGNLTYFGGLAGDTLTGGAGNDTIFGGAGNDAITGGLGTDTAGYLGVSTTYSVVTGGGNVQIVDNDAVADGDDGTDTVVGIEFARFSDQTISITSPIILDLDGGGVSTLSAARSSARFDMDGDGIGDDTSWFGRGEGLLFLDRDGNGTLSGVSEMSFTGDVANARSDLEGLAAFDSNGDGQLSKRDAQFASFKIWRDRDGDGVVDRGEVMSLNKAGVRSLSLSGTNVSGTTALGDTAIVNTGSFTRTNGRTGRLADAVLTAFSSAAATERGAAILQTASAQRPAEPLVLSVSDDAVASSLSRTAHADARAAAIDTNLLSGSFDDALAQLASGPAVQQAMPVTSEAIPLVMADYGNWIDASLDRQVLLMTQDMAAFGPNRAVTELDRWHRNGTAQPDVFAA